MLFVEHKLATDFRSATGPALRLLPVFVLSFFLPCIVVAENLHLTAEFESTAGELRIEFGSDTSLDACILDLFMDKNRAAAEDHRTSQRIFRAIGRGNNVSVVVRDLPSLKLTRKQLKRRRRRKLRSKQRSAAISIYAARRKLIERVHLSAVADCSNLSSELVSNSYEIELQRERRGVGSVSVWIQRLRALFPGEQISTAPAFPKLAFTFPTNLVQAPGDNNRFFVTEQAGVVKVFESNRDTDVVRVFLDLSEKVVIGIERGLVGLTFHPNFAQNGFLYVYYTAKSDGRSVLARYRVDSVNSNRADPASETVLLTVPQPSDIHHGGALAFGPDGYLYIAVGDGGPANDVNGAGQDRTNLLGTILRIDVDRPAGRLAYGIPDDNPFVGNAFGYRPEIYAYGFRNPFRLSFDSVTSELWTGDVGQERYEEIDIVKPGGNYGWSVLEGDRCFRPAEGCDPTGTILPVATYGRGIGAAVVAGGVYRGTEIAGLQGSFLYGDFVSGAIFYLPDHNRISGANFFVRNTQRLISTFGTDSKGEMYFLSYLDGKIFQIVSG